MCLEYQEGSRCWISCADPPGSEKQPLPHPASSLEQPRLKIQPHKGPHVYTLEGILVVVEDVDQEEKHHQNVSTNRERKRPKGAFADICLLSLGQKGDVALWPVGGQSTCMPEEGQSGGEGWC